MWVALRDKWEKHWPELSYALTGGLSSFVWGVRPKALGSTIPVFCYHLVEAREFERDLSFLARNGYSTIDGDTLLQHMKGSGDTESRTVVLTFDDGARNLFEVAYPLLRKYDMRAVAFIAPRFHRALLEGSEDRSCTWQEIRDA